MKRLAVGPMTTPEYNEWWVRRINGNIREPSHENKLEKKIEQMKEEKMNLRLDVDVQKLETLTVQADMLSVKYELELSWGQELASLLRKIRLQKEMQDQMQERLEKIQQDMMEKKLESQKNMVTQLTQLLAGGNDKGKDLIVNVEKGDNDGPLYPPGFTPPHVQPQAEVRPRRSSVTIRPQQFQVGTSMPMNFQTGLGFNPERTLPIPLSSISAMESSENYQGIDAKNLSLVLDLVLPHKFKMLEFEKYNGTSCPKAHVTMFCRRMTGYVNNDQLLIHCFQDSLIGVASKCRYGPYRITLRNMEKKPNESLKQYSQRWRELVVQVQPPLLEKEITMLFINTLKVLFITHMLGSGKIEAEESNQKAASKKKENEVNNMITYN
ncbi:hypothetical protein Goshw_023353 [Gossypium schwendimanii]|uniref:Uncharacterized protein n=1 Tax=Gossypium schwendimanii TaxID=34291 RepID=A0A7J9LXS5_GOSSC|nr:hypothetical protein [Gossypium schwendimanii]